VTGTANALTYGQFVAMEYVDLQLEVIQRSPDSSSPSFLRAIVQYDNSIALANRISCIGPNCGHDRSPPHSRCQHTRNLRSDYAFAETPANSDTGYLLGTSQWIGHQGLHRNPSAKRRSHLRENLRRSAILRSHRRFFTSDTGLEACDWLSQNEAVQLMTEKAVTEQ